MFEAQMKAEGTALVECAQSPLVHRESFSFQSLFTAFGRNFMIPRLFGGLAVSTVGVAAHFFIFRRKSFSHNNLCVQKPAPRFNPLSHGLRRNFLILSKLCRFVR